MFNVVKFIFTLLPVIYVTICDTCIYILYTHHIQNMFNKIETIAFGLEDLRESVLDQIIVKPIPDQTSFSGVNRLFDIFNEHCGDAGPPNIWLMYF